MDNIKYGSLMWLFDEDACDECKGLSGVYFEDSLPKRPHKDCKCKILYTDGTPYEEAEQICNVPSDEETVRGTLDLLFESVAKEAEDLVKEAYTNGYQLSVEAGGDGNE